MPERLLSPGPAIHASMSGTAAVRPNSGRLAVLHSRLEAAIEGVHLIPANDKRSASIKRTN
jgi:hypothetical protein